MLKGNKNKGNLKMKVKYCGTQKINEYAVGGLLFTDTSNWNVFQIRKKDMLFIHNQRHTNYWWTTCYDHNQAFMTGKKSNVKYYLVLDNGLSVKDLLNEIKREGK